ncbi:hypothetical protein KEM55_006080 [Ascosphaera atra]|nr:hypothetical protein KEM55_006080 [Ascosphaera atra]
MVIMSSTLDLTSYICLAAVSSLLPIARLLTRLLPEKRRTDRLLMLWHAYDAMTHFLVEGSYLWNCFFTYVDFPAGKIRTPPYFLNRADRLYGAGYGTSATARLWQEYGKADRRWIEADAGVISLEILTVVVDGTAAVYVCYLLYKSVKLAETKPVVAARYRALMWFMAITVAVCELYGGWMTFAPEWLTGSTALNTENPVYLWLYLAFFNGVWVVVPIWVLWKAWQEISGAFASAIVPAVSKKAN